MRWYKLMRWAFRNKILQATFNLLHPYLAYRLGKGWSKQSRLAKSMPYTFRGEDEPLYQYAVEFSKRQHVDYFIFGHYHVREDITLPTGAEFLILKDWMDPQEAAFICFDGETLRYLSASAGLNSTRSSGCTGTSMKIE